MTVRPVFILSTFLALAASAAGQGTPSSQDLKKAEALIVELYGDEIVRAERDTKSQLLLARSFMHEARETTDYPAGRVALLERAREMFLKVGDGPMAMQALEEILQQRQVKWNEPSALRRKMEIFSHLHNTTSDAATLRFIADGTLNLVDDAVSANDYAIVNEAIDLAEIASRELKNVALLTAVRQRHDDVEKARAEFEKIRPFADRLAKTFGKDPEAATRMGIYHGLLKGDWAVALPLLARGDDAAWKSLAAADLAKPADPARKFELAQKWARARELAMPALRLHVDLRTSKWLQEVISESADPTLRSRAASQLEWTLDNIPAEYRVGEIASEWRRCDGHDGPVYSVAFTPDGKKMVSVGADGDLHVWDPRTGKELRRWPGQGVRLWAVAVAPDNRRVVTGGFDGAVRLWDLATGEELRVLGKHGDYVRSVGCSSDGKIAYSSGDDRVVRLWDIDSGKMAKALVGHDHFVWGAALSSNGRHLISASHDRSVRWWDAATGSTIKKLDGHKDTVLAAVLSHDGRTALTASTDSTLKVWDIETGLCAATLDGHEGFVHALALSSDGRRALSAGQDRTVRLWDVSSRQPVRVLSGHRDQVWGVAFSRDGRLAASASQDGTVRIWAGPRSVAD